MSAPVATSREPATPTATHAVIGGWREHDAPRLQFVGGDGARCIDADGREYIDLTSQAFNLALGHFPRLRARRRRPLHGFVTSPLGVAPEAEELGRRLLALAGPAYGGAYFTTGGALAVEAALAAAREATGRREVLSLRHAYHGGTVGTMALAGWDELRARAGGAANDHVAGESPTTLAAAREIAEQVRRGAHALAAVLAEPVISNQAIVPPPGFWAPIRAACDATGVLLIFDEVVTGLGRTGRVFAQEHYGVEADLLVLSKALSAGVLPLGATLLSAALAERFRAQPFPFAQTDENHPACCASGLAVLREIERRDLPARAARLGETLGDSLRAMRARLHPLVAEVRGLGLLWGIELCRERLPDDRLVDALRRARADAMRRGLLLAFWGRTLVIAPPLVIAEEDLREGLARLESVLEGLQ